MTEKIDSNAVGVSAARDQLADRTIHIRFEARAGHEDDPWSSVCRDVSGPQVNIDPQIQIVRVSVGRSPSGFRDQRSYALEVLAIAFRQSGKLPLDRRGDVGPCASRQTLLDEARGPPEQFVNILSLRADEAREVDRQRVDTSVAR